MNSHTVMFTVFRRGTPCSLEQCEISGFRHKADANCALLGYYTACSVNYLPTFRDNLSVPSSRVKKPWILTLEGSTTKRWVTAQRNAALNQSGRSLPTFWINLLGKSSSWILNTVLSPLLQCDSSSDAFHKPAMARQHKDIRLQRFLPVMPTWQHYIGPTFLDLSHCVLCAALIWTQWFNNYVNVPWKW